MASLGPRLPGTLRPAHRPASAGSEMRPFLRTGEGQRGRGEGAAGGWGRWDTGLCVGPLQGRRCAAPGRAAARGWSAGALARKGVRPGPESTGKVDCVRTLAADGAERAPRRRGQRRGGQPDVESVGRTLRSAWCLGCWGAAAQSVERAARGAAAGVGEAAGLHTSAAAGPGPGRLN